MLYSRYNIDNYIKSNAVIMTRPANMVGYTALDMVANDALAANVLPIIFTISDINAQPLLLRSIIIRTIDTGVAISTFRVWLYQTDPSAAGGIISGDNVPFSTNQGTFLGSMIGTFRQFNDGSVALCTPEDGIGQDLIAIPVGNKLIYGLMQTLSNFNPSANSTTFTLTINAFQARI